MLQAYIRAYLRNFISVSVREVAKKLCSTSSTWPYRYYSPQNVLCKKMQDFLQYESLLFETDLKSLYLRNNPGTDFNVLRFVSLLGFVTQWQSYVCNKHAVTSLISCQVLWTCTLHVWRRSLEPLSRMLKVYLRLAQQSACNNSLV
jgi:hypothetical protein